MHSSLARRNQLSLCVRLAFAAGLTLLLSGWTCSAFFFFNGCQDGGSSPQLTSLWPDNIPRDAESVTVTLEGTGFTSRSQVLWNGGVLDTVFTDSDHLQTTITQQTFDWFGGSVGNTVLIAVRPQGSTVNQGCSKQDDSTAQPLKIR